MQGSSAGHIACRRLQGGSRLIESPFSEGRRGKDHSTINVRIQGTNPKDAMPRSNALKTLLQETAEEIRQRESAAKVALGNGDRDAHMDELVAKCELLEDLPDRIDALPEEDPLPGMGRAREAALSMSQRASQALSLESPFYMANLLYPDHYEEGQMNELEVLIDELYS